MPSRRLKTWLVRLLLIAIGLILSLVILEIYARAAHLGSGGFWEPHSEYGWRNIPGAKGWESCYGECAVYVEINSLGLRDREIAYERPAGKHRILFLGDSMTAGMQVPLEATFTEILESGLRAEGSQDWEIINAGINAFGTDNELIFYRQEGYKYDPELLVLAMYLANDIYNNHRELEVRLSGSGHKPYFTLDEAGGLNLHNYPVEDAETVATQVVSFLNRHFQLPRFIAQTLNVRREIPEVLRPLVELASGKRAADVPEEAKKVVGNEQRVDICSAPYAPQIEEAWAITKAILLELQAQAAENDSELIVLVIPAAPQIIPPNNGEEWYCELPNIELAAFLEAQNIPFLDLLYPFRDHSNAGGEALYYNRDFHLNEAGHRLAGEQLIEFISPGSTD